jgi:multiple sugar transport system permease protein
MRLARAGATGSPRASRPRHRIRPATAAKVALLIGVGVLMILPGWMILVMAVSPEQSILTPPPKLVPPEVKLEAFPAAIDVMDLGRAFANSVVVALSATLLDLTMSALAGYAFARVVFPGRDVLFVLFLATLMIPIQLVMVPLYLLISHAPLAGGNDLGGAGGSGLLNSYPGLVLPVMVRAVNVFLFRQYFRSLPREFGEQAKIDGCSEFGTFRRIYLPLAQPILVTVALLSFITTWNELIWPLISTTTTDMHTLQVALLAYRGTDHARLWSVMMAGNVVCFVLPVLLYLAMRKYIIRGLAFGGLKG